MTKRLLLFLSLITINVLHVQANTIVIDTDTSNPPLQGALSGPFILTIAQTFTTPQFGTDIQLLNFGFYLLGPSTVSLKAYVYEWDYQGGLSKVMGAPLFQSDEQSLKGDPYYDLIEFTTPHPTPKQSPVCAHRQ